MARHSVIINLLIPMMVLSVSCANMLTAGSGIRNYSKQHCRCYRAPRPELASRGTAVEECVHCLWRTRLMRLGRQQFFRAKVLYFPSFRYGILG
jgi:hypothetical protein